MKFAMSYSFGKDSALALWHMLRAGHQPVCLLTTVQQASGRSWFHGVDAVLRREVAQSLGLPLLEVVCGPERYNEEVEAALRDAREMGAAACAFGDIDIDEHLAWNQGRCESAGLLCMTPLWNMRREDVVAEVVAEGFQATVKCAQTPYEDLLGRVLDGDVLQALRERGADVCGENGEYHTFVWDGPMFAHPVEIETGEVLRFDTHSAIDIRLAGTA